MKLTSITFLILVIGFVSTPVKSTMIYEDFEDGDYTNNPAWWVYTEVGADEVTADPIRSDNLVWKAYGTDTGHRVLKTSVSGIPWDTFDVSLEYRAASNANFHGAGKLETTGGTDGIQFGLWYDTNKSPSFSTYANLWVEDYGYNWQADGTYTLIPIGDVPRDQWLKLRAWYDGDAGLVRVEARILETDVLLGQVSRQSVYDLSQMGSIDVLGIGIEETHWQYMDNVLLTPEPTTIILFGFGVCLLLKRNRQ